VSDLDALNEAYETYKKNHDSDSLYRALRKYGRVYFYFECCDAGPDSPHDLAVNAIRNLNSFAENSKFSTWVYGICKLMRKMHIRAAVRKRRVFDPTKIVSDVPEEGEHEGNFVEPTVTPDVERQIEFAELFRKQPEPI
jgi:DNA-directed RNA polymerase specialized sigma24 family protein